MIQLFSATVAVCTEASRNRVDVEIQFRKSNADRVTSPCGGGEGTATRMLFYWVNKKNSLV